MKTSRHSKNKRNQFLLKGGSILGALAAMAVVSCTSQYPPFDASKWDNVDQTKLAVDNQMDYTLYKSGDRWKAVRIPVKNGTPGEALLSKQQSKVVTNNLQNLWVNQKGLTTKELRSGSYISFMGGGQQIKSNLFSPDRGNPVEQQEVQNIMTIRNSQRYR